jgi:adenylate kinase
MLNIILCGAPGSGKGTQSEYIVQKYGLEHLSTGDLLRREIASGSRFGKQIDAIISKGNLVSDDIMLRLIDQYMEGLPKDTKGVIFDGFPRTLNQAIEFEKMLTHKQTTAHLIDLDVDEEELIRRLLERGKTSGRADDNLETIKKRLVIYHHQTEAVSKYYKELKKYHPVKGTGTIEEIFGRICEVIDSL